MINLGFTTAGLFFLAGFVYERLGSTLVEDAGGIAAKMPLLATFFLIIGMASIGLPGTNGFIGEFLVLLGVFQAHWMYGAIAVTGVIFAAAYFLWYYERAIFGPLGTSLPHVLKDLSQRETVIAISLCVMIFWIGLYPAPFLNMINGSIAEVVQRLEKGSVASAYSESSVVSKTMTAPLGRTGMGHKVSFSRAASSEVNQAYTEVLRQTEGRKTPPGDYFNFSGNE